MICQIDNNAFFYFIAYRRFFIACFYRLLFQAITAAKEWFSLYLSRLLKLIIYSLAVLGSGMLP